MKVIIFKIYTGEIMKFFNRESEIKEILHILNKEPDDIYFIYGSMNSGKTTLINHIINNKLNDNYKVFYINFRTFLISEKRDFIEAIFTTKKEGILEKIMDKSEVINLITKTTKTLTGIPIPEVEFNRLFDERINDAFQYLNDILLETKKSGKIPVLIFDELQMIKEITANGQKYLLKELFQFLVSLTKERHLAHCLCLTSDSLFAEYVYNKGELRGRAKYLLVDDFDKETSFKYMDFLAKENNIKFSNEQKEQIYSTVGGKPKDIKYAVEESMFKDLNEILEMMLNDEYRNLNDFLMDLDYINLKVPIRNGIVDVKKEDIINTLKLFKDNYEISVDDIPKAAYICLVKEGILFLNPRKGTLKPQSFLVWNGIKKLI
jgi:AAA+ ATPase superfamily predicted ATPase